MGRLEIFQGVEETVDQVRRMNYEIRSIACTFSGLNDKIQELIILKRIQRENTNAVQHHTRFSRTCIRRTDTQVTAEPIP